VRERARKDKKTQFTALLHHLSLDRLRQSFYGLQKQAAPGVDGVVWSEYGEHLEANLQGLHTRVQGGTYRAKPSRRVYIPKADGRERPLGIAALEDKIVQGAMTEVLNAIFTRRTFSDSPTGSDRDAARTMRWTRWRLG
jgi:retron-type reverse transcriptase